MAIVTMEYVDTVWVALIDDLGNETDRVELDAQEKATFHNLTGQYTAVAMYRGSLRTETILHARVNAAFGDTVQISFEPGMLP